jgi:regulator of RNase E activity RraA
MGGSTSIRIFQSIDRPAQDLLDRFRDAPTGFVADAFSHGNAMWHRIKPLDPAWRICGPAVTVKTRVGDNLLVWKALDIVQPGDVLVIAVEGDVQRAIWGDRTSAVAAARGVVGMVTDGVVRDVAGILDAGMPIFSQGSIPQACYMDGPGEINVPVSAGGVLVHPGDIVVGDRDGVVVVPAARAVEVADALDEVRKRESDAEAAIARDPRVPESVDRILATMDVATFD